MKAIIPAAGFGTRLRPHTYTQPKALLHVAGKPIFARIVDELAAVGIDNVIPVVGYLGDRIEAFARGTVREPAAAFCAAGGAAGQRPYRSGCLTAASTHRPDPRSEPKEPDPLTLR